MIPCGIPKRGLEQNNPFIPLPESHAIIVRHLTPSSANKATLGVHNISDPESNTESTNFAISVTISHKEVATLKALLAVSCSGRQTGCPNALGQA